MNVRRIIGVISIATLPFAGIAFAEEHKSGQQSGKQATTPGSLDMAPGQGATPDEYAVMPIGGGLKELEGHDLAGSKVKNAQGKEIGTLEKLIIDTKSGKVAYGVLSLPEQEHMLPVQWSAFKVNRESGQVVLNAQLDQLQPAAGTSAKDMSPSVQKLVKDIERLHAENKQSGHDPSQEKGLGITKQPAAGGSMGEDKAGGAGPGGPRALPEGQAPQLEGGK